MRVRPRSYLILTFLWAAYFHPLLLHPDWVLQTDSSDFGAQHLPAKLFLNREWRATGELPLWNPYHFCGAPFIHDIQVGIFYPPYAVTYLVPESNLGRRSKRVVAPRPPRRSDGLRLRPLARSRRGRGTRDRSRVHVVREVDDARSSPDTPSRSVWRGFRWCCSVWKPRFDFEACGRRSERDRVRALVLGTHPQWTFYGSLFAAV